MLMSVKGHASWRAFIRLKTIFVPYYFVMFLQLMTISLSFANDVEDKLTCRVPFINSHTDHRRASTFSDKKRILCHMVVQPLT